MSGRAAPLDERMKPRGDRVETPHPTPFGGHLLPQGEKGFSSVDDHQLDNPFSS